LPAGEPRGNACDERWGYEHLSIEFVQAFFIEQALLCLSGSRISSDGQGMLPIGSV
jgi:hypothetical protein